MAPDEFERARGEGLLRVSRPRRGAAREGWLPRRRSSGTRARAFVFAHQSYRFVFVFYPSMSLDETRDD